MTIVEEHVLRESREFKQFKYIGSDYLAMKDGENLRIYRTPLNFTCHFQPVDPTTGSHDPTLACRGLPSREVRLRYPNPDTRPSPVVRPTYDTIGQSQPRQHFASEPQRPRPFSLSRSKVIHSGRRLHALAGTTPIHHSVELSSGQGPSTLARP